MGSATAIKQSDETKKGYITKNWHEFCWRVFLCLQDTAVYV